MFRLYRVILGELAFITLPSYVSTSVKTIDLIVAFRQIVRLKKAMNKQTFWCFTTASSTLHNDLRTFYCCQRHEFAYKNC